jgi:hypothetical protein
MARDATICLVVLYCALLTTQVPFYFIVAPCSYSMILEDQVYSPSLAFTLTILQGRSLNWSQVGPSG